LDEPLTFEAVLESGDALPADIVCSKDGVMSGVAQAGTAKDVAYNISVTVQSASLEPFTFLVVLTIYSAERSQASEEGEMFYEQAKKAHEALKQYWQEIAAGEEHPDLDELLNRDVTPEDVYYMLERFATLVVWNADDLNPPSEGKLLKLKNASPLFRVYDFGVVLVASPVNLFDVHRPLGAALETARAMMQEVQRRKWNIEMAGLAKMMTAAWVEVKRLNLDAKDHQIEVHNYEPRKIDFSVLFSEIKPSPKTGA
ncbi:MAG: hypothetical protein KJ588_00885, partial [Gammaproteobacteria bacterium]|nr:hypothetical protein [Gammaproteobacteria bacterium]